MSRASLLTLPCELRNAIYELIFTAQLLEPYPILAEEPNSLAQALQLHDRAPKIRSIPSSRDSPLRLLQTCKQIHDEAHLMALSMMNFPLLGPCTNPAIFRERAALLPPSKLSAIRRFTLTARISHLRALNESWSGLPFGQPNLRLDLLVLIPKRPDVSDFTYAEIADLSQCHTLAYILGETFKSLRNVKCVEVRNESCFNEVVWRLVYRSLVYRLWRWGGSACGIRFESGEIAKGEHSETERQWFRAWFSEGEEQNEVGDEVTRLVGDTV